MEGMRSAGKRMEGDMGQPRVLPRQWFMKVLEVTGSSPTSCVDPPPDVTALPQSGPFLWFPKVTAETALRPSFSLTNPFTRPVKETNAMAKRVMEVQDWKETLRWFNLLLPFTKESW